MGISFEKKTWVNRQSQNATRRKLTKEGTVESAYYIVERADDVEDPGTPFSASSMNSLEDRIAAITANNASQTEAGFMSTADKIKLDSIQPGATKNVITSGTSAPSGGNDGDIYLRFS